MPAHKNLTGVDLHEPKGVESAASGSVYIANGSGSGVWSVLDIPEGTFTIQEALFTSSGAWNKPSNAFLVRVIAQGGGEGVAGGGSRVPGENTTFGAHLTATGGGTAAGSSGDINLSLDGAAFVTNITSEIFKYTPSICVPFIRVNGSTSVTGIPGIVGAIGNVSIKTFAANVLGSSETVSIGAGGVGTASGTAGMVYVQSFILI